MAPSGPGNLLVGSLDRVSARATACREVLAQIFEDVEQLSDQEVIERAEMIVGGTETLGAIAEQLGAPLAPDHLPALDPSMAADVTVLQAELHLCLERDC
jgi:hypothetical protein